ncbi:small and basic intrinsic protein 2;1 [Wolffia australiana]
MGASVRLLAVDLVISFAWVWAGGLVKIVTLRCLEAGIVGQSSADAFRYSCTVLVMFFFAWLGIFTNGGSYNPLTVLSNAVIGDFSNFLFTVLGRIPIQVVGSMIAVGTIKEIFPEVGRGPKLNVDIHQGALTEGLLTFTVVIVSLGLKQRDPRSFFMKTWIQSISKLSLHILGSDLTGGCMNPASAFAWAYHVGGKHTSREHLVVYWLAPIEATLLSIWIFRLIVGSQRGNKTKKD